MLIQLLIIQIITFIGLIFVLRMVFYRQLNSAIIRLKHLHEENLAREKELEKELERIKQEREIELAKAKEEAARIVQEAKEKSERITTELQGQAKEQAKNMLEQSKAKLAAMENELLRKHQDLALELSLQMLELTFTQQGKAGLQHQLITELIEGIKNLEQEKFTIKTRKIKITTACPLDTHQKLELTRIFSDRMGEAVELEEVSDPAIIAGLIVQIGALTLDGSLRNKLKKIIPYLKGES
jgi:F-type H+-transporting ATPase subunit b